MHIDVHNAENIKNFLKLCSKEPGIYKMISTNGEVIYVGKAKSLASRLSSYFNKSQNSPKVTKLVEQIASIETTVTNTEAEALILECNLIKELKPKYNILLRDDKSYPYICISYHDYPRIFLYRGKKISNAECFGPYPNAHAAKQTIRLLQQVFLLRVCTDGYYNNRTRPCLLYQINRCSAPCVEYPSKDLYSESVQNAKFFLKGQSKQLIEKISHNMYLASEQQKFEQAALFRDQIQKLQDVAQSQIVESKTKASLKPTDVIAILFNGKLIAIAILKFREGKLVTSNQYVISDKGNYELQDEHDLFLSVLSQFYLNYSSDLPQEIIINVDLNKEAINLLSELLNNSSLKITQNPKGIKNNWLNLAIKNSNELLARKGLAESEYTTKLDDLIVALGLVTHPNYIECFDISHTFGKQTIASSVVFDGSGPCKDKYRRYNIQSANGDDILAMKQVLMRRFKKKLDLNLNDEIPDMVLIDGGKAQVNAAKTVFSELGLDKIKVFGITKGEGRRACNDRIISAQDFLEIPLGKHHSALLLLQKIRDEAHRFALVGHRKKRDKANLSSILDEIPGVGNKRRKNLLSYLGGWQQVLNAKPQELSKVPGISIKMAELIYNYLHKE